MAGHCAFDLLGAYDELGSHYIKNLPPKLDIGIKTARPVELVAKGVEPLVTD